MEMSKEWLDYLEALNKCCDAVKLTAYHTRETAKYAKEAGVWAGATVVLVNDALKIRSSYEI